MNLRMAYIDNSIASEDATYIEAYVKQKIPRLKKKNNFMMVYGRESEK